MDVVVELSAQRQKAHRREPPRFDLRLDQVGGELLVNEAIERRVLVEGPDDVIAIGVGIGPNAVVAEHEHAVLGVGVAGDVEPVPAPALAIVRRRQQPIDQLRPANACGYAAASTP